MTKAVRNIINWEIEKGRLPIQVCECLSKDEQAPEGFPILVTFTQVRLLTQGIANAVMQNMSGERGILNAARYLHEEVGRHALMADCIAVVKTIRDQPTAASSGTPPQIILRNMIWMKKVDWEKYMILPHISAEDPELRKLQRPPIEGHIEWPEEYKSEILNPGGERDIDKPPADKMAKGPGTVTVITSKPTGNGGGITRGK